MKLSMRIRKTLTKASESRAQILFSFGKRNQLQVESMFLAQGCTDKQ